jgi:hypothetical protein
MAEKKQVKKDEIAAVQAKDPGKALISASEIREYFCPLATEKELFRALGIVKSQGLNPFIREVHFIKYSEKDRLAIVVGYEVYLKRAEMSGQLDGWKCGVDEKAGIAWVEILRKDWREPFRWEVSLSEFSKNQATWKTMPTFMAKKVAIAQGFRLAFPVEVGGLPYTQEEHAVYDIDESQEKVSSKPKVEKPAKETADPDETRTRMNAAFEKERVRLGDEFFFEVLGKLGFESVDQMSIEQGRKMITEVRVIPTPGVEGREPGEEG